MVGRGSQISGFDEIVGSEITDFLKENSAKKVLSRVSKAEDHYVKAHKLRDIDNEMAAIRLIAAEEELVVALFEHMKLNPEKIVEEIKFVRSFRNHRVKLAFYPVLQQFRFIVSNFLKNGITLEGLEDKIDWKVHPKVKGDEVGVEIVDQNGEILIFHDPLHTVISREDLEAHEVVEEMYSDFRKLIEEQFSKTVKQFVSGRADYRNKLLYAEDGGYMEMGECYDELMPGFKETYHDLIWVLAILVGTMKENRSWLLVGQFIRFYKKVLDECGLSN